jgi:Surfeit locus protein 5 subunit 22 of Mediator complex
MGNPLPLDGLVSNCNFFFRFALLPQLLKIDGGGHMLAQDPPPPPLAADVALSTLQCQLAAENICVASSHILSLIRTLRLSLLLMDEETMDAEEQVEVERTKQLTQEALKAAVELEQQYMELQMKALE